MELLVAAFLAFFVEYLVSLVSAISDVVVALSTAIAAGFAVLGVTTWRKEMRERAAFDTARTMLRAVLRLREELHAFRSPLLSAHEFPTEYEWGNASAEEQARAYHFVYGNRMRRLVDAYVELEASALELEASALEAEALWGEDVQNQLGAFRSILIRLQASLDAYVNNAASNGADFKADREFGKRVRQDLAASRKGSDPDNELSWLVEDAVGGELALSYYNREAA